jgi:hypothetical protein
MRSLPPEKLAAAIGAAIGGYLFFAYLQRPQPSLQEAAAFVRLVDSFVVARTRRGQPCPASVQLRDLVEGGFVTQSTAQRFDGSEIVVSQTRDERRPQDMLVRLRLRDGHLIALLVDGSVQQLPP